MYCTYYNTGDLTKKLINNVQRALCKMMNVGTVLALYYAQLYC